MENQNLLYLQVISVPLIQSTSQCDIMICHKKYIFGLHPWLLAHSSQSPGKSFSKESDQYVNDVTFGTPLRMGVGQRTYLCPVFALIAEKRVY